VKRIFRIGELSHSGTRVWDSIDTEGGQDHRSGNAYVQWQEAGLRSGRHRHDRGPSEVLVIADSNADASLVAADMLAQAEHDEMASAVLLTPDEDLARRVSAEVAGLLAIMERNAIAVRSIEEYGAAIVTRDMDEAVRSQTDSPQSISN